MDAQADTSPIAALKQILRADLWTDDPDLIGGRLEDWRGRYRGHAPLMALPRSTSDVADIVSACARLGVAITPQGGNTGLVGAATPQGEILLSTQRLTAIRAVDPTNMALVAEAGATLSQVQTAAREAGLMFPMSLGSEGAATVGGLISTNAGGVNVVRYGMMRDLVLGLEVVLPDGRAWDGVRALRKDNRGYDLKQLFIGAEGTLGVVTAAVLKLFPAPKHTATVFGGAPSAHNAIELLAKLRAEMGDGVSAIELIPRIGVDLVLKHIPGVRDPLDALHPWYVLIDVGFTAAAGAAHDELESLLAKAIADGLLTDAVLAKNEGEARALWTLRETLPEAEKKAGRAIKHDISTPPGAIARFLERTQSAIHAAMPDAAIIAFGHVGDGNLHFNVTRDGGLSAEEVERLSPQINAIIYDAVAEFGGSISAEHGIGVLKRELLAERYPTVELDMMRAIKSALDPANIMNPRVLVSSETKLPH